MNWIASVVSLKVCSEPRFEPVFGSIIWVNIWVNPPWVNIWVNLTGINLAEKLMFVQVGLGDEDQ